MNIMEDRREAVYDEKIQPLMAQILEICQEAKIACLFSFLIGDAEEHGPLYCTSALLGSEYNPTERQKSALAELTRGCF